MVNRSFSSRPFPSNRSDGTSEWNVRFSELLLSSCTNENNFFYNCFLLDRFLERQGDVIFLLSVFGCRLLLDLWREISRLILYSETVIIVALPLSCLRLDNFLFNGSSKICKGCNVIPFRWTWSLIRLSYFCLLYTSFVPRWTFYMHDTQYLVLPFQPLCRLHTRCAFTWPCTPLHTHTQTVTISLLYTRSHVPYT